MTVLNKSLIFKHLISLEVEDSKDMKSGYSITFNFSPNSYFEDAKLTKTFTFTDDGTTKITATPIKWKEGMPVLPESTPKHPPLAANGIGEIVLGKDKEACRECDKNVPIECFEGFNGQWAKVTVSGYDTQLVDVGGVKENSVKESGNECVAMLCNVGAMRKEEVMDNNCGCPNVTKQVNRVKKMDLRHYGKV
ncbi:NAP1-related protein 2-like protein isoform X1, partial [Tanacetum coccineum]